MNFVKHFVDDMDYSGVQCCIICGEIICDYRNALVERGHKLTGWPSMRRLRCEERETIKKRKSNICMMNPFEIFMAMEATKEAKRTWYQKIWEDYIKIPLLIAIPIGILIGIYLSK